MDSFSSEMAAYVRDAYSDAGVEIEGTGAGRIRLRMPPEFHDITRLAQELCVRFGGRMDLVIDDAASKCVILEVYETQTEGDRGDEGGGSNAGRDPPRAARGAAGRAGGNGSFCERALAAAAPVVAAAAAYAVYTVVARERGGAAQQAG